MNKNTLQIIVTIVVFFSGTTFNKIYSQLSAGASVSPIFGASPFNAGDGGLQTTLRDPNWGLLPSQQMQQQDIWGRQLNRSNQRVTRQMRDVFGNVVLTDINGNVIYDAQGRAIIDTAASNALAPDDLSTTPPPPPDDTLDVPLDGGVLLLMIIATGLGYRKRKSLITT